MFSNGRSKQAVVVACLGILGYLLCTVAITQTINKANGTDIVVLSPSAMEQITAGAYPGPWSGDICYECTTVQSADFPVCHEKYSCSPTNTCDGSVVTWKRLSKKCVGAYRYGLSACRQRTVAPLQTIWECQCTSSQFCNTTGGIDVGDAYECNYGTTSYCI